MRRLPRVAEEGLEEWVEEWGEEFHEQLAVSAGHVAANVSRLPLVREERAPSHATDGHYAARLTLCHTLTLLARMRGSPPLKMHTTLSV